MISVGIDPSTKTGLVILDGSKDKAPRVLVATQTDAVSSEYTPSYRGSMLSLSIVNIISKYVGRNDPAVYVIEGYAMNRINQMVLLCTIGTLIRKGVIDYTDAPFYEVAPTSMKKFVTGHGRSSKEDVISAVDTAWGYATTNDNIADAYGLAVMGLAKAGELNREISTDQESGLDKLREVW